MRSQSVGRLPRIEARFKHCNEAEYAKRRLQLRDSDLGPTLAKARGPVGGVRYPLGEREYPLARSAQQHAATRVLPALAILTRPASVPSA